MVARAKSVADVVRDRETLESETFAEWVSVSQMFVDKYARPVGEAQINRMIRSGFDVDKLGVIMLSLRNDGRYAILDGNHRVQMARKHGVTKMFARVFIDKTYEEEADLFVAFNTVNRPSALDRYRARLEMGELRAVEIEAILRRHGLHMAINGPSAIGGVSAVSSIDKIYDETGPVILEEIVSVLKDAWGFERRAWISKILDGMRQFWIRYRSEVDRARLIDRLSLTTPERVLAEASVVVLHSASAGTLIGKTVHEKYNQGLRKAKLGPWVDHPGKAVAARRERDGKR